MNHSNSSTFKCVGFADKISRTVVQTGVSTGVRVLTKDLSSREALAQMVVNAGAAVAGGFAAEKIGDLGFGGHIEWLTHKFLHGLLGAGIGAASNLKDPRRGAAGGAMGAIIAETVAENLPSSLSGERKLDIAALTAGTVAFLARQDVNAAGLAGTIAAEYNANAHSPATAATTSSEGARERTTPNGSSTTIPGTHPTSPGLNSTTSQSSPSREAPRANSQSSQRNNPPTAPPTRSNTTSSPSSRVEGERRPSTPSQRAQQPSRSNTKPTGAQKNAPARDTKQSASQTQRKGASTPARAARSPSSARETLKANRTAQQQERLNTAFRKTQPKSQAQTNISSSLTDFTEDRHLHEGLAARRLRHNAIRELASQAPPPLVGMNLNRHIEEQGLQPHTPQKKMVGAESRSSATTTHPARNQSSFGETIKANRTAQQHKTLKAGVRNTQPTPPMKTTKASTKSPAKKEETPKKPAQTQKKNDPSADASSKAMADALFNGSSFEEETIPALMEDVERGRTATRRFDRAVKRSKTPPPIPTWFREAETIFQEGMQSVSQAVQPVIAPAAPVLATINEFQGAPRRVLEGALTAPQNISLADVARTMSVYGLDFIPGVPQMRAAHQMNGMVSDGVDALADTARTNFRREFREITEDQLTGQWIGDGAYAGVHVAALLFNPFKVPPGSNVVSKTLRTVVGAVEKEAVKVEQKVATNLMRKAVVTAEASAATTVATIERQAIELSKGSRLVEDLNLQRAEVSLSGASALTPQVRPTVPSSTTATTTRTAPRQTPQPATTNAVPQVQEVPKTSVTKSAQLRLNYQGGRGFQNPVHEIRDSRKSYSL
jgi:hypothetical protein